MRRRGARGAASTARRFRALTLAAVLLATVGKAHGAGVDTYTAPASAEDLLQTERANAEQGHLDAFGRISLAYAKDPLVLRNGDGTEVKLLGHQLGVHPAFGLALWGRAQIAVLLPLYFQSGAGLPAQGEPEAAALGDAALDLRFALLRRADVVEFALASRIDVPTSTDEGLAGGSNPSVSTRAILSRGIGEDGTLVTASVGTRVSSGHNTSGLQTDSALLLSLGGVVAMTPQWGVSGEGAIDTQFDRFFGETSTPANLLFGVRYRTRGWLAHLGAGPGLSRGVGAPDFRVVAMAGTDSILAEREAAASTEPLDSDGDGIDDAHDACRGEAEDEDGYADEDGCPERDNDEDGIDDLADGCPEFAEDEDGFADEDGCPDDDNDNDGTSDASDQCPNDAEDLDNWRDDDGCPDDDNDNDGVADGDDQCPNEKETPNGVADDDGCPDFLRVEQAQIRTLEPIYFEYGSARIQQRSRPLLAEMAALIASRDDLGVIAIEGHTDDQGADTFNLELSQRRAESVLRFLVEQGVQESRLSAKGLGETQPIADNGTTPGREQNRRVEFRLTEISPPANDGSQQGE